VQDVRAGRAGPATVERTLCQTENERILIHP
jgi:hypothetical protein